MSDPLSPGDIALIVSGIVDEQKRDPGGACLLLKEIGRRLENGEPVEGTRLAEYLTWALKRFQAHCDASRAFGVTRAEHRPRTNVGRDVMIAFFVQREISYTGKSIEDAALAVQYHLAERSQPISLSYGRIANIYKAHKGRPPCRGCTVTRRLRVRPSHRK